MGEARRQPAPARTTGLYHTAIRYPDRAQLADALRRLGEAGIPLTGASDHGVSEALYLNDPDGNGVELYRGPPERRVAAGPGRRRRDDEHPARRRGVAAGGTAMCLGATWKVLLPRRRSADSTSSSAVCPRRLPSGSPSSARRPTTTEKHFIGWRDDVDPDELFTSGKAWGLSVVRRPAG